MDSRISIDRDVCIGCGLCASVCIRENIAMRDGHPVETCKGIGCFDCGHCLAVCPVCAISLNSSPGFKPKEIGKTGIDTSEFMDILESRRSIRWFSDQPVTDEELDLLMSAASTAPSILNSRDVEFAIVDRRLMEFMRLIADIMGPRSEELPRFAQLRRYLDDPEGPNPLLWDGKQIIVGFSENAEDSVIAMSRIELMAHIMGLGGFYSHWIQMADAQDHERLMSFFPDVGRRMKMGCVFVIGHPRVTFRRTVPRRKHTVHRM